MSIININRYILNRRIRQIKSNLTLMTEGGYYDGSQIIETKRIVSQILRGFSNDEIVSNANEMFYFWDRPDHWDHKKPPANKFPQ